MLAGTFSFYIFFPGGGGGLEWAVRVYVSVCLVVLRNSNSGGVAFALFCFSSTSMKWNLFRKFRIISALGSVSWDFWAISLRSSQSPSSSNSRILLMTTNGSPPEGRQEVDLCG